MYALSHYTRGTLGLVNLFCRTWSISSLNGVKFYAEGGKWECRHHLGKQEYPCVIRDILRPVVLVEMGQLKYIKSLVGLHF